MAAVVTDIVVGAGERGDGLEAVWGRWDDPTQANSRGDRLDCGETTGLDEAGSSFVVMSCRAHIGTFMRGEGVLGRSPGSMSVDPESGIVCYPMATKIWISNETPSRGSMSTRPWPATAGTP